MNEKRITSVFMALAIVILACWVGLVVTVIWAIFTLVGG